MNCWVSFFSQANCLNSTCRPLEGYSVLSPELGQLQFKPFKNLSKYLENEGGLNGGRDINISKAFHSLASVGAFRFQFVSRFSFPFLLLLSGLWTLDTGPWTLDCDCSLAPKCDKMSVCRSHLTPSLSVWSALKIGPFIVQKCCSSISQ